MGVLITRRGGTGTNYNPYVALNEAEMKSYLETVDVGSIVKYSGSAISRHYDIGDEMTELVFNTSQEIADTKTWVSANHLNIITYDKNGTYYLKGANINSKEIIGIFSITQQSSPIYTIWDETLTETKGWNSDVVNSAGKLLIYAYDVWTTISTYSETPSVSSLNPISCTPYVSNKLYKVVYDSDVSSRYYEEYIYISDTKNTATATKIGSGYTAYDFTGTLITGTGSLGGDNPLIAENDSEMTALLVQANEGKFIQFTGTTGTWIHNAYYQCVASDTDNQYYLLDTLSNEATASDIASGKEAYGDNGVKITGTAVAQTNVLPQVVDGSKTTISASELGSITSIRNGAFYLYYDLVSVTLPNTVTSIGEGAFEGCEKLSSVTIGSGVTSIEDQAFKAIGTGGTSATVTILATTPPTLNVTNGIFYEATLNKIIVPQGTLSAYQSATNWSDYASYMEEAQ